MIRVLRAGPMARSTLVAASELLPHINIPIGSTFGDAEIQGVLDSGSGVNIGYYGYWADFAQKYPQYVVHFGPMDVGDYNKILVGGISKEDPASPCSHYIEISTPLRTDGQPVSIRIALTQNLSTTLLIGTPFLVRGRMVIHMAESYVFSNSFQKAFPIQFLVPHLRDKVPVQDAHHAKTFIAARKCIARPPSRVTFKDPETDVPLKQE